MRCGIANAYVQCKCILNLKQESVFLKGPEDDSIRIETCRSNTTLNVTKFVVFDRHIIVYSYLAGRYRRVNLRGVLYRRYKRNKTMEGLGPVQSSVANANAKRRASRKLDLTFALSLDIRQRHLACCVQELSAFVCRGVL
jgi:hypothetical protein